MTVGGRVERGPERPSRGSRRALRWAPVVLILSGCSSAPLAERYFDRLEPFDTLLGFAYAVDAGQYRFAYESIRQRPGAEISFSRFRFALRWNMKVPEVGIPIRDLIVSSKRSRYWKEKSGRENEVAYEVRVDLGDGGELAAPIFLERETEAEAKAAGREDSIWFINLEKTADALRKIQGQAGIANTP